MLPVESVIPDALGIGFLWIVFSLRPPFLSGVLGSWQEVAYMLPKLGGGNRNTVSHTNPEDKCQYALGVGVCSRISLESVPASQVIKVKGNEQSNRWQTQMWEKNTH